jgi:hypothetical protein
MMTSFAGERFDAVRIAALGPRLERSTSWLGALFKKSSTPSPDALVSTGEGIQFPVVARHQCSQEEASLVIALWNQLPDGLLARCHVPGFAIEVLLGPEVVFTAALCWECDNVSMGGRLAKESWRTFNAGSDPALRLLRLCKETTRT